MSNPNKNTNLAPTEVDNDDAEHKQPADGEKNDDSSNQKSQPRRNKIEQTSVSSSSRIDKKRLTLEAAIAGDRAETEIGARKRQLDMKKGNLIY